MAKRKINPGDISIPVGRFSNGTEYVLFQEKFCFNCEKYRMDNDGLPLKSNCRTEEKIARAMFDPENFPKNNIRRGMGGPYCSIFTPTKSKLHKKRRRKQLPGQMKIEELKA